MFLCYFVPFLMSMQRSFAQVPSCHGRCVEVSELKKEVDVLTHQYQKWAPHYHFVNSLNSNWKQSVLDVMEDNLEEKLKEYERELTLKITAEIMNKISNFERKIEAVENQKALEDQKVQDIESDLKNKIQNLETNVKRIENRTAHLEEKEREASIDLKNKIQNFETNVKGIENRTALLEVKERDASIDLKNKIQNFETNVKRIENRTAHLELKERSISRLRHHSKEISKLVTQNAGLENNISALEEKLRVVENKVKQIDEMENVVRRDMEVKIDETEEKLRNFVSFKIAVERQSYFDNSFTLIYRYSRAGYYRCHSNESYDKITSKLWYPDYTGQGNNSRPLAPSNINADEKYSEFFLSNTPNKYGDLECRLEEGHGRMKTFIAFDSRPSADLKVSHWYKFAHNGGTVQIRVHELAKKELTIKWKHNGEDIPSWDGLLKVNLRNIQPTDAGTYECFYEGRRENGTLVRLTVRRCKANLYGDHCDQMCPPCYNGGICHETLGLCVCPGGFAGTNCEVACGENRFGSDCSMRCRKQSSGASEDCGDHILCRPHPQACHCAAGFMGVACNLTCDAGWYGAVCQQPCHCANGTDSCDRVTGACRGGCSSGWSGNSCQIKECERGSYGTKCDLPCHCDGGPDACDRVTGACKGGCSSGWRGNSCHIKDADNPLTAGV